MTKIISPKKCLLYHIRTNFKHMCFCAEHKIIAKHLLLDLVNANDYCIKTNSWDKIFVTSNIGLFIPDLANNWSHAHFIYGMYVECSFNKYIIPYNNSNTKFNLNRQFYLNCVERTPFNVNQ